MKLFSNHLIRAWTLLALLMGVSPVLSAVTIAEKKAGLSHGRGDLSRDMQNSLTEINEELEAVDRKLHELYKQVWVLFNQGGPESAYADLLQSINQLKHQKVAVQEHWRELSARNQSDDYALWHQPSSTLEQLVIDYGSQDYVYLIPPDIADMVVSINSNLPIPRAAWPHMLDTILNQSGIGIKELNPFLRQLYLIKEDRSGVKTITNKRSDLWYLPGNERIAYLLTPEPCDVKRVWLFLEKFANPQSVYLQQMGRDILIVGRVSELQELLKLYDFLSCHRGDREYKLVTMGRVDAAEMSKLLGEIFGTIAEEPHLIEELPPSQRPSVGRPHPRKGFRGMALHSPTPTGIEENGLKIIPLAKIAQAIFLVGTREEIRKAEGIIREIECEIGETRGKVIYRYVAKHSNPEELAQMLVRIYTLMVETGASEEGEGMAGAPVPDGPPPPPPVPGVDMPLDRPLLRRPYNEGFFLDDRFVINQPPIPGIGVPSQNQNRDNFLVDPKTGAIVMVVEADILPKLKDLIRKIDIPKKMVQVDVLLVEKRLCRENNFGLNLLKIGSCASHTNTTVATFNDHCQQKFSPLGIFEFFISRKPCHGVPAYDLSYRFLLAQQDVQINANPSVIAINQTPAFIEIAEEISVNTGIFEVETISGVTLKNSYARAIYGIKINITPNIHLAEDQDEFDSQDYVTMLTDVTFQSFKPSIDSRPDVTTRHIVNEVSIPDGQTVILGGLRRRDTHEKTEKIPFLGEIPGVGKLFSLNDLRDESSEMFIFITPHIIKDQAEDLERMKLMELCYRPGDIPAFLCQVERAHDCERDALFRQSMMMLFGRIPDRCVVPSEGPDCPVLPGVYDGR